MSKEKPKFIDYLDKYQAKQDFSYYDSVDIHQKIQNHFLNNYSKTFSKFETAYDIWQKEHTVQLVLPQPKIKKTIEISIHKIEDIIELLNQNPYDANVEYNIDLKSLHNVREELEHLNQMIGMSTLKTAIIQQMIYFMQELHISSDPLKNDYKHTIFMGPPGTGKTEMAKIVGKMYSKLGILKKNVFRKVTRSDLVAGYLGQTAIKTRKVIDECLGGVLFIDEAYSLGDDSFAKECIDTLCEALSDHKDDLMVIVAGYEDELKETFFKMNPGMASRFMWKFYMDTYTPKELMKIFEKQVTDHGWNLQEEYKLKEQWFHRNKEHFKSYGRDMEILFSCVKMAHAQRIFGKDIILKKKISELDLENGLKTFIQNKKDNKKDLSILYTMYI
jgi:SpoVK/Ycf46/Vps4 family AAA+-type ATPase